MLSNDDQPTQPNSDLTTANKCGVFTATVSNTLSTLWNICQVGKRRGGQQA